MATLRMSCGVLIRLGTVVLSREEDKQVIQEQGVGKSGCRSQKGGKEELVTSYSLPLKVRVLKIGRSNCGFTQVIDNEENTV